MSMVNVEIHVTTAGASELYLVGSTPNLGVWNVEKAVKFEKNSDGSFSVTKKFDEGQLVEFKVLSKKDWAFVEKGVYGEELENHLMTPHKGLVYELDIARFNK